MLDLFVLIRFYLFSVACKEIENRSQEMGHYRTMPLELLKDKVILDMAETHTMPRLSLINSQTKAAIASLNHFLKCISAVVLMNTRFTTECVISRGSISRRQNGLIKTQFTETQTKRKKKANQTTT